MNKPRLLDLFCGAGGCAVGYARAGFDVVGVDINPQPHYPFEFHQGDAMTFPLDGFDVIHASPPCQAYSVTRHMKSFVPMGAYPKLIDRLYQQLYASERMWVIENVLGAPMPDALLLCGSMFGLKIRRHRLFASSMLLFAPISCQHTDDFVEVIGGKIRGCGKHRAPTAFMTPSGAMQRREGGCRKRDGQAAMGIDWMTLHEMCEAIPPAYTEWIGRQLLSYL